MRESDNELLRQTRFYEELGADLVGRLAEAAVIQTLPKGTVLFREGEPVEYVHFLLQGSVGLFVSLDSELRDDTVVEVFSDGELFVAPAAILELPYLVTGRLTSESRIMMISAAMFRRALQAEHRLALAITNALARHWRILVRQIADLKLRSGAERLAAYLLSLATTHDLVQEIRLPVSRRVLAARLGMKPESLTRVFAELSAQGVQADMRRVRITDMRRLRAFAGRHGADLR